MGNTTSYTLTLRTAPEDWREVVTRALAVLGAYGFRPSRGRDERWLVYRDGDVVECDQLDQVVAFLASQGGLIGVLGDVDDLQLQLDPSRLQVCVSSSHTLRPERDRALLGSMERIFVAACRALEPVHGYAHDEWSWEALDPTWPELAHEYEAMSQAIASREPPPVLFWTSYFATDYFARIEDAVADLDARVVRDRSGVLVHLPGDAWGFAPAVYADGRYRPSR